MKPRSFVVSRVVAIVEKEKVKALTGEIPRVIVVGPSVGMHMLDVIEHHDHGRRHEGREEERKEPNVQTRPVLLVVMQVPG